MQRIRQGYNVYHNDITVLSTVCEAVRGEGEGYGFGNRRFASQ